jgi:hypothetical protein
MIAVMIAIVPIPLRSPSPFMLIPPAMTTAPASLAYLMKFMTGVFSLSALPAVTLDCFVEPVICSHNASLAIVVGMQLRNATEHQETQNHCGRSHLP